MKEEFFFNFLAIKKFIVSRFVPRKAHHTTKEFISPEKLPTKKIHSGAFHKKNCLFFVHVGMWLKKAAERHAASVRAEIYCRMCVCKQFPKQLKGSYEKTSKYLRFLCHINARHSMFFSFSYTKKNFLVESLKSENMTN